LGSGIQRVNLALGVCCAKGRKEVARHQWPPNSGSTCLVDTGSKKRRGRAKPTSFCRSKRVSNLAQQNKPKTKTKKKRQNHEKQKNLISVHGVRAGAQTERW